MQEGHYTEEEAKEISNVFGNKLKTFLSQYNKKSNDNYSLPSFHSEHKVIKDMIKSSINDGLQTTHNATNTRIADLKKRKTAVTKIKTIYSDRENPSEATKSLSNSLEFVSVKSGRFVKNDITHSSDFAFIKLDNSSGDRFTVIDDKYLRNIHNDYSFEKDEILPFNKKPVYKLIGRDSYNESYDSLSKIIKDTSSDTIDINNIEYKKLRVAKAKLAYEAEESRSYEVKKINTHPVCRDSKFFATNGNKPIKQQH